MFADLVKCDVLLRQGQAPTLRIITKRERTPEKSSLSPFRGAVGGNDEAARGLVTVARRSWRSVSGALVLAAAASRLLSVQVLEDRFQRDVADGAAPFFGDRFQAVHRLKVMLVLGELDEDLVQQSLVGHESTS